MIPKSRLSPAPQETWAHSGLPPSFCRQSPPQVPRRPQLSHLPGSASSNHASRQHLAHYLHFTNWNSSMRHRNLFSAWEDGNQFHKPFYTPGLALSELLPPVATRPLSHLESDLPSPAEPGQQPGLFSCPTSSLGLSGSEVMGPLMVGTQSDAEKVSTRESGNGMKGKPPRDKAGARDRYFGRFIRESQVSHSVHMADVQV